MLVVLKSHYLSQGSTTISHQHNLTYLLLIGPEGKYIMGRRIREGGALLAFSNCYVHWVTGWERHLNASHVRVNAPPATINVSPAKHKPKLTSRSLGIMEVTYLPPRHDANVLNIHVGDRGDKSSWFIWSSHLYTLHFPFQKDSGCMEEGNSSRPGTPPPTLHHTHSLTHTNIVYASTCTYYYCKMNKKC